MYGNIAKHQILRTIINWAGDGINSDKGQITKGAIIWMTKASYKPFVLPRISFTHRKIIKPSVIIDDWINRYYTYLLVDKYIEQQIGENKKDIWVSITDKGIAAISNNYFLTKQNEYKSTLFRDVCTFCVAFATVIALMKDDSNGKYKNDETVIVKQQIDTLKLQYHKLYQQLENLNLHIDSVHHINYDSHLENLNTSEK